METKDPKYPIGATVYIIMTYKKENIFDCPDCHGSGERFIPIKYNNDFVDILTTCPSCRGGGIQSTSYYELESVREIVKDVHDALTDQGHIYDLEEPICFTGFPHPPIRNYPERSIFETEEACNNFIKENSKAIVSSYENTISTVKLNCNNAVADIVNL